MLAPAIAVVAVMVSIIGACWIAYAFSRISYAFKKKVMKTVKVHVHCTVCGFTVDYDVNTNEHGFFVMPEVHCPNDLLILEQELRQMPVDVEGGE